MCRLKAATRSARQAFTLLEILLVLAILVAVLAAAAPALRGVMKDAQLRAAADQVRVEWTRAHVKAMKTGRIQVFRFELGGAKFTVQPWAAADDALEGPPPIPGFGLDEEESASPRLDVESARALPEGTQFVMGAAQTDARALGIEGDISDANRFENEWSQPILFYPDGSTSDAYAVVANEEGEVGIRIELRGMTGTATLGEITALEELQDSADE
ncbi:MAG: prepilin-type N-terminal cleavage/methylation domain-containing protein [Pirellulaceae bacterium]